MPYVASSIIISTLLSALITGILLRIAHKKGWALPTRDRDVHVRTIPRIGGLAIFLTFFVVTVAYHLLHPDSLSGFGFPFAVFGFSIDKRLLSVLIAGLILALTMVYDDIYDNLRAYKKLSIQVLAALVVIAGGIGISYLNNPFGGAPFHLDTWQIPIMLGGVTYHFVVIADILAVLWLVFLMNVLNFSDGIDGLAGSISIIALGVLAVLSSRAPVLQPATALVASIGIGSVLGFLLWNLPPARIFMGDSGSMFLGFLIGVLGIIAGAKLATTLVVLAIPIIDALWVVTSRVLSRKNPFTHADQSHLHHRFLQAGFSVRQTLLVLVGMSVLFGSAALQGTGQAKVQSFIVAILLIVLIMITVQLLAKKRRAL